MAPTAQDIRTGMARLLTCLGDLRGQKVVLVTDEGTPATLEAAAIHGLVEREAEIQQEVVPPADGTDTEPPASLTAIMAKADAVVELTTVSIRHSQARQDAQAAGTRYLYLGAPSPELFTGEGAMYADFAAMTDSIERLAGRVTSGSEMRMTSERGTDLTIDLEGRVGRALTGMATRAGQFGTPPCLEWGLVPSFTGVTGRLVADAWAVGLGLLSEPIQVEVVEGRAVHIADGVEGRRLRDLLDGVQTPHAYQVSEVGVGMNPEAKMIDDMMSAEAVLGTAHIAVGTTPADPGVERVEAGLHVDLVFWRPTIQIDDEFIMKNGSLCVT